MENKSECTCLKTLDKTTKGMVEITNILGNSNYTNSFEEMGFSKGTKLEIESINKFFVILKMEDNSKFGLSILDAKNIQIIESK
jgi:Fe2+ transport system protein FeoA